MSSEPTAHTPRAAIALVRAEQRREMLERLADHGMAIAGRLTTRAVAPEIGEDIVRHAETFARIARGVRLTLILETRLDGQILAFRNGDAAAFDEPETASNVGATRQIAGPARTAADCQPGRDSENPVEGAEYDRLPTGGFRAWVETICDDLGLDPDWTCWSDEEGFIRDDGQPVTEWPMRAEPGQTSDDAGDGLAAARPDPHRRQ